MINANFLTQEDGRILGFTIVGHSDYSEIGSDIVCAAVSSAVYLIANTITDVLFVSPLSLRISEGDMLFRVEPRDEHKCRDIFIGLRIHLIGLEEQYPEFIKVSYLEV